MLLFRRVAQRTTFLWAVAIDGAPVTLQPLALIDAKGSAAIPTDEAAVVQVRDGQRQWRVLVNLGRKAVSAAPAEGGTWSSAAAFAVRE